jgi:hypothetical protein
VLEDTATGPSRARALLNRRRKAMAAGFRLHQAGDCESVLVFDPSDPRQAHAAILLVKARRKRLASDAQLANLQKFLGRTASQSIGTKRPASCYTPTSAYENKLLAGLECSECHEVLSASAVTNGAVTCQHCGANWALGVASTDRA